MPFATDVVLICYVPFSIGDALRDDREPIAVRVAETIRQLLSDG